MLVQTQMPLNTSCSICGRIETGVDLEAGQARTYWDGRHIFHGRCLENHRSQNPSCPINESKLSTNNQALQFWGYPKTTLSLAWLGGNVLASYVSTVFSNATTSENDPKTRAQLGAVFISQALLFGGLLARTAKNQCFERFNESRFKVICFAALTSAVAGGVLTGIAHAIDSTLVTKSFTGTVIIGSLTASIIGGNLALPKGFSESSLNAAHTIAFLGRLAFVFTADTTLHAFTRFGILYGGMGLWKLQSLMREQITLFTNQPEINFANPCPISKLKALNHYSHAEGPLFLQVAALIGYVAAELIS